MTLEEHVTEQSHPTPVEGQNPVDQNEPIASEANGPAISFAELGLSEGLLAALAEMGFSGPTEVQAHAVPPALEGKDLLVQSRTGSGKTAAFGIPIAQQLQLKNEPGVQALVLAPTRELALQVHKECERIGAPIGLRTMAIYGGAAMGPQVQALEDGAQFVAGTPGRVLDHIRRKTLDTSNIRFLVLDEADEMLSMGFLEEINAILDSLPKERQTFLFSATIPHEIERLSARYLKEPVRLYLSEDFVGVREIDHVYYLVTGGNREADLLRVLEFEAPESAIIFCNTRDETSRVADFLGSKGYSAEAISSDLTQNDRERVMKQTRAGKVQFLVATDIAARGIDIADLSHVFNYSFPENADIYVHRTGRTGRAGKSGIAISLVSPREIGSFYYLKLIHRIFPVERHLPSSAEMETRTEARLYETLRSRYEGKNPSASALKLAQRAWSSLDGLRLTAMALQEMLEKPLPAPAEPRRQRSSTPPREASRGEDEAGRDEGNRREDESRQRAEASPRGRSSEGRNGRDRGGRGGARSGGRDGDRPRRSRSEGETEGDRQRKTTRSRPSRDEGAPPQQESFTTGDGDIEFFETVDLADGNLGAERPAAAERRPRQESRSQAETQVAEGQVRLYVNLGRRHNLRSEDLTSFLQIEGDLSAEQIGAVQQRDRHTFVDVASEQADGLVEKLSGASIGGRKIKIERAKAPGTR